MLLIRFCTITLHTHLCQKNSAKKQQKLQNTIEKPTCEQQHYILVRHAAELKCYQENNRLYFIVAKKEI